MGTPDVVQVRGQPRFDVADQAVQIADLAEYFSVIDNVHPFLGSDRHVRRTDGQDHVIRNRADCMRHRSLDQVDFTGFGGMDTAVISNCALTTEDREDMMTGVRVRRKPRACREPNDIGANSAVANQP
ncbi:MAG TPA: hypothetical protein VFW69_24575 [Mycobacterium sp.]|nr:hypothetical protein [Mycobacterium sp.]